MILDHVLLSKDPDPQHCLKRTLVQPKPKQTELMILFLIWANLEFTELALNLVPVVNPQHVSLHIRLKHTVISREQTLLGGVLGSTVFDFFYN